MSEREKFYITEKYHSGTGQAEKAIQALELYVQTYPGDAVPRINLSVTYQLLGDFDKALTNSLETIRLEPDSWYGYENAAYSYVALARFDEAKALINTGLQKTNNPVVMHADLYYIALVQDDKAAQEREEAFIKDSPSIGVQWVLGNKAGLALAHGQRQKAREIYAQEGELAKRLGLTEIQAAAIQLPAWADLLFADTSDKNKVVSHATEALTLAKSPDVAILSRLKLWPSLAVRRRLAV